MALLLLLLLVLKILFMAIFWHYAFYFSLVIFLPDLMGWPIYGFVTSVCVLLSFGSLPFLMPHCSARSTSHLSLPDLPA